MRLFAIAFCAAFFAASALAQDVEETPAEPRWKGAPDYPAACQGKGVDASEEERVDIAFKISSEGLTEDVRVMRSTNACFEEAAVAAVRSWVYAPRRVNGRNRPQEDMEATFIFELSETTQSGESDIPEVETNSRALVFDARPIERIPPEYPPRCRPSAYANEYVIVEFDVTIGGETKNQRIKETTNDCFSESALNAVKDWKYEPRFVDGVATDRVSVVTLVIFRNDFGRPRPENVSRPAFQRRLGRVRRLIERGKIDDAIKLLEKVEATYGDSMSQVELANFHRMRAMARIGAEDLRGALDDLKAAKRLSSVDQDVALQNLINQLEAALGTSPNATTGAAAPGDAADAPSESPQDE